MKTLKGFLSIFWIKKNPKITNGSKYSLAKQRRERARAAVNGAAGADVERDLQRVTNLLQC